MKTVLALFLILAASLHAQQPPAEPKPAEPKPAEEAKPAAEEKKEAAAPIAPATERNFRFTFDAGYRFLDDVRGDFATYRSVVNLGEGPKLFGGEFDWTDPKSRLFDRLSVAAHNWGGDPYNTLRVTAERSKVYRLRGDYRNISYYNFLPSFANPGTNFSFNERSFDLQRRSANVELELIPSSRIVPYLAYSRDSGRGTGITPFVTTGNEYPVATRIDDGTHYYRGGVRIESRWAHVTLEQGTARFKDDQQAFTATRNPGNRTTTLLGQTLVLNSLLEAYRVRGENYYSKAIITATPVGWANLYGQFLYSRPTTDVSYSDSARGNFYLGGTTFFSGLDSSASSEAKMPRSSGSFGAELRPLRWVRIMESWSTDRYHTASSALLAERFLFSSGPAQVRNLFSPGRLVVNYSRQQADLFVDVLPKVTLRLGHRYTWGDALVREPLLSQTPGVPGQGRIRMHSGLAGLIARPYSKLSINLDYEFSPGDENYFRTSLQRYHLGKARARWQAFKDVSFAASFQILDNRNPDRAIGYEYQSRVSSASVQWLPKGGKRIGLLGEYSRSTLRSNISFLVPLGLFSRQSIYLDNAHSATGTLDINLPHAPRLSVGGSLFRSWGSRPTRYYQPFGRIVAPFAKHIEGYFEWRWYGFSQPLFLLESFRSHQLQLGLRVSM